MSAKVKKIAWYCPQCGKRLWLRPGQVRNKKFCSRPCHHAGMRVENPVRAKQSAKRTFGPRECDWCHESYEAKAKHQRFCSQACALEAIKRRAVPAEDRVCETCEGTFKSRPHNRGRFCSRECMFKGSRGPKAAHWKGGRHLTREGYVRVYAPDHPKATGKGKYVQEHRLVLEKVLGRYLTTGESVHHRNGDKADNRPENLELRTRYHGKGATKHCPTCTCEDHPTP